jgi:uncharacterized alkaline shock family protein YloU
MAEGREYISHESELGSVSISEEVLTIIAAAAAVDVEGVSSLGSGLSSEGAATANRKALTKGVRLWVEDERVAVDLPILVRYGYVVTDVAKAVQEAVFAAVENTSGLEVAQVNVTVAGVTFQK